MSIVEQNKSVFKGRFGWHNCDITTYRKLRVIRKHVWQEIYDFCRWQRWARKLPHNRHGEEPDFAGIIFTDKKVKRWPLAYTAQVNWKFIAQTDVWDLITDTRTSRTPYPNPDDVCKLRTDLKTIDELYTQIVDGK